MQDRSRGDARGACVPGAKSNETPKAFFII